MKKIFLLLLCFCSLYSVEDLSKIEVCKTKIKDDYELVCIANRLFVEKEVVNMAFGNGVFGYGLAPMDRDCRCELYGGVILDKEGVKK